MATVSSSQSQHLSENLSQDFSQDVDVPKYKDPRQLSPKVWEQCIIYFEESLREYVYDPNDLQNVAHEYTDLQGLTLLKDIIAAGPPAAVDGSISSCCVPPPFLLAFASTLAVHPLLTTKAGSTEALYASNLAFDVLKTTFATVGPLNARAADAFVFAGQADTVRLNSSTAAGGKRKVDPRASVEQTSAGDDEELVIRRPLAQAFSLWSSAEDFWHVVGWAFICSVQHPKRWDRWQPWLELMLEVLEQDWSSRVRVWRSQHEPSRTDSLLHDSLIMQYFLGARINGATPSGRRRIMRAILANGDEPCLREFREVFKNETKERRKRDINDFLNGTRKLDLEAGELGDYGDDEEEDDLKPDEEILAQHDSFIKQEHSAGRRNRRTGRALPAVDASTPTASTRSSTSRSGYGGSDALVLRQRFLFLLTMAPNHLPRAFATHEDIYDVLTEFIRPLSLPIFTFMITPTSIKPSRANVLASWLKWLLYSLGNGPRDEGAYIDQLVVQQHYAPYSARQNTLLENARMAVTLEALLRLMLHMGKLRANAGLKNATEVGIAARLKKAEAASFGARAETAEMKELWVWLNCAEEGIRGIVDQVERASTGILT